jgi:DNA-binding response OmpR family regulator
MNIAIIDPDLSQTSQIEQALMLSNERWQTSVTCESVSLEFMLNSQWLNEPFDCFIFNGIDLLSQVSLLKSVRRQSKTYVPMIVLTHTRAESEFVALLDAGADDCLCKPFRPRELSARVQSLFRQVMQITASAKKLPYKHLLSVCFVQVQPLLRFRSWIICFILLLCWSLFWVGKFS